MPAKITLVGGGSTHWTPTLLVDFANSKTLEDAEITLVDVFEDSLPPMLAMAENIAKRRDIPLKVKAARSLEEGLEGADAAIATLSIGGFGSMAHDIEIPYRYGIRQPVGDSVGPGGIFRSLRSIPAMVDIAKVMEKVAPDAYFVNVSNPLTSLTRAVGRETSIKSIGLCNEMVGFLFVMSLLFDTGLDKVHPVVGGVNHLPLVTSLSIDDQDGFRMLRDLLEGPSERWDEPIWMAPPDAMHARKLGTHDEWTKGDIIHSAAVKFEIFKRFGVLPGSSDTHVVEFFPWFLQERNDFGRDWGIHHYGMSGHSKDKEADNKSFRELSVAEEIPEWPSGELVATLLEGLFGTLPQELPVNIENTGQVTNLENGVIVECMGIADKNGVRPKDTATVPGMMAHRLEQIVASQELTVEAALSKDPNKVLEAMLVDPIASALAYEDIVSMTSEMLLATKEWLPGFGMLA